MGRLIGSLDYTDGGQTGFTHTNEYIGNVQNGIAFQCVNGGISGIARHNYFFSADNNVSGIANNFMGLLSSGNFSIMSYYRDVWTSGQNIYLDANQTIRGDSDQIVFKTRVNTIQLLANTAETVGPNDESLILKAAHAITLSASTATNITTSNGNVAISSTNQGIGISAPDVTNGRVDVSAGNRIKIASTGTLFISSNDNAIVSGVLATSIASQNTVNISGMTGLNLFAGPNSTAQINMSGIKDINIGSQNGNIYIQTKPLAAGGTVTVSGSTLNLQASSAINAITDGNLALIGITRADLISDGSDLFVRGRGPNTNLSLQGKKAVTMKSDEDSVSILSATNGGVFTGDINILSNNNNNIIASTGSNNLNPKQGNNLFLVQSTGTSSAVGKNVFANTLSNNRAPINVSGVTQVESLMTAASAGDFGFQSPGNESGPGAGRLWLNTGSGMAPISVGSGYFFAYDNLSSIGGNGITLSTSPTALGFNTQVICDRQYQHNPNGAPPVSGTITVSNDGLYKISYNSGFTYTVSSVTTGIVIKCQLYVNNVAYNPSISYASTVGTNQTVLGAAATTMAFLRAGDFINLAANRVVGGSSRSNNNETWICIERLR